MNATHLRRAMLWKIWRQQRMLLLVLVALFFVVEFAMVVANRADRNLNGFGEPWFLIFGALVPAIITAGVFGADRRRGEVFLDALPLKRSRLWMIEVVFIIGAVAGMCLVLLLAYVALQPLLSHDFGGKLFYALPEVMLATLPPSILFAATLRREFGVILLTYAVTAAVGTGIGAAMKLTWLLVQRGRPFEPEAMPEKFMYGFLVVAISIAAFAMLLSARFLFSRSIEYGGKKRLIYPLLVNVLIAALIIGIPAAWFIKVARFPSASDTRFISDMSLSPDDEHIAVRTQTIMGMRSQHTPTWIIDLKRCAIAELPVGRAWSGIGMWSSDSRYYATGGGIVYDSQLGSTIKVKPGYALFLSANRVVILSATSRPNDTATVYRLDPSLGVVEDSVHHLKYPVGDTEAPWNVNKVLLDGRFAYVSGILGAKQKMIVALDFGSDAVETLAVPEGAFVSGFSPAGNAAVLRSYNSDTQESEHLVVSFPGGEIILGMGGGTRHLFAAGDSFSPAGDWVLLYEAIRSTPPRDYQFYRFDLKSHELKPIGPTLSRSAWMAHFYRNGEVMELWFPVGSWPNIVQTQIFQFDIPSFEYKQITVPGDSIGLMGDEEVYKQGNNRIRALNIVTGKDRQLFPKCEAAE